MYVAQNGEFLGGVLISDKEKPTAKAAVKALRDGGVRTVMLTGDGEAAEMCIRDRFWDFTRERRLMTAVSRFVREKILEEQAQ